MCQALDDSVFTWDQGLLDDRVPKGTSFDGAGGGAASGVSGECCSEAVGFTDVEAARVP
jgi:hypothetical protein